MKPLHPRRAKLRGEKYLKFRCTECGNCCSDTLVPVTDEDVRRIMRGTGLKALEICDFYKPSDFDDDGGEDLVYANLDGGRKTLGLKRRHDAQNGRMACAQFRGNRCSIYEHRPVTCRVWPFSLVFDSSGRRLSSLSINPALPCPYELDGKVSPAQLVSDWRWDDRQDEAWASKVRAWNQTRSAGSHEEFLAYLGLL